jgi:hypothetical protein
MNINDGLPMLCDTPADFSRCSKGQGQFQEGGRGRSYFNAPGRSHGGQGRCNGGGLGLVRFADARYFVISRKENR